LADFDSPNEYQVYYVHSSPMIQDAYTLVRSGYPDFWSCSKL